MWVFLAAMALACSGDETELFACRLAKGGDFEVCATRVEGGHFPNTGPVSVRVAPTTGSAASVTFPFARLGNGDHDKPRLYAQYGAEGLNLQYHLPKSSLILEKREKHFSLYLFDDVIVEYEDACVDPQVDIEALWTAMRMPLPGDRMEQLEEHLHGRRAIQEACVGSHRGERYARIDILFDGRGRVADIGNSYGGDRWVVCLRKEIAALPRAKGAPGVVRMSLRSIGGKYHRAHVEALQSLQYWVVGRDHVEAVAASGALKSCEAHFPARKSTDADLRQFAVRLIIDVQPDGRAIPTRDPTSEWRDTSEGVACAIQAVSSVIQPPPGRTCRLHTIVRRSFDGRDIEYGGDAYDAHCP